MRVSYLSLMFMYVIFLFGQPNSHASIVINEILTATEQEDATGESLEWIELYNTGDAPVNLENYVITDNPQIMKWQFPAVTLDADAYLILFATGHDQKSDELHVNFQLDREGEPITLFDANGVLVDSLNYPTQRREVSYGRYPNGSTSWMFYESPSPGEPNSSEGALGITQKPSISKIGGIYSDEQIVTLSVLEDTAIIYFTLDGSTPTENSNEYDTPITIDETTALRARAYRDGHLPSETISHSYIIEDSFELPVIVLSTNPDNLFDRREGIYVNATEHGRAWERETSVEYFTPNGTRLFGVDAGLRIHGGASRQRSEKKSFRLYFRNEYGPSWLNANIIPSTEVRLFDRLQLRAGYNDSWSHWDSIQRQNANYMSDQITRELHGEMGSLFSHGTYVELYLNEDYWGLYNLCERIDDAFFGSYSDIEDWDVVSDMEVKDGDSREWNRLIQFVSRENFRSDTVFEEFSEMVDVAQLTSYYILNIYIQNHDWPHHNWYAARPKTQDGKWIMTVWDAEDSFGSGASRGSYNLNTMQRAQEGGFIGDMFGKMISNEGYQQYFIEQLEQYLNGTLAKANLLKKWDEHAAILRPMIQKEADRWNTNRGLEDWEAAIEVAKRFIDNREDQVRRYVYQEFQLPTPTATPVGPSPTPTQTPIGYEPSPTPTPTITPTPTNTPSPTQTPTPLPPSMVLGIFEYNQDIGNVDAVGDASYDPESNQYMVRGSGDDIWNTADEFHFLYREVTGDFMLQAKLDGQNFGGDPWAKLTLMARDSLEPGAKHFASRLQESTREASSQWREQTNGSAGSTGGGDRVSQSRHDGRLRLVREGDVFQTYYLDTSTDEWTFLDEHSVEMNNTIYVGLAVTSHNDGSYAEGFYTEVEFQFEPVSVADWQIR